MVGVVAVASKLVVSLCSVVAWSGEVAQFNRFSALKVGSYGDTVLCICSKALDVCAHLGGSEGDALHWFHHPFHCLCGAGRFELHKGHGFALGILCLTSASACNGEVACVHCHCAECVFGQGSAHSGACVRVVAGPNNLGSLVVEGYRLLCFLVGHFLICEQIVPRQINLDVFEGCLGGRDTKQACHKQDILPKSFCHRLIKFDD